MNKVFVIAKKEINSHFNSAAAYVVLSVFLIVCGWLFTQSFFISGQASMRRFFELLPVVFMFILPAVTMSSWSEEKRSGTIEVLMTFPVSVFQTVLAKFLSSLILLSLMLFLTVVAPIMIFNVGKPDSGSIIAGYFGALFIGSSYIAIGLWISSVLKNQIASFIMTVSIIFVFYIIGNSIITDYFPEAISNILMFLSFSSHFNSILRGVVSLSDIVYYLSVVVFFLFLNARVVSLKKWN